MADETIIALVELAWWNEIAALFGTVVSGWTGKASASFANGIRIEDSRVASKLYKLVRIEAGLLTAEEAAKETATDAALQAKADATGWE